MPRAVTDSSDTGDAAIDLKAVRDALRVELQARGFEVASDTGGLKGELYILGAGDVALALFEFKTSAGEALETMYQGSWLEGMPPRFAVVPSCASDDRAIEVLEQVRIVPLMFEASPAGTRFRDLDRLLREHVGAA